MNQQSKLFINPVLKEFWKSRTAPDGSPIKFRVLYGGRCSGKSYAFATMAVFLATKHRHNFLCLRTFQNRISDSVYTLLRNTIESMGFLDQFKILADSIINVKTGSVFKFYGFQKNSKEIKSFEGGDGCICWFEEAQTLTSDVFDIVRPTVLRGNNCEMWFSFNPDLDTDFAYQMLVLNPPAGTISKQLNYTDNCFINESALADIESQRELDRDKFNHIYLGKPKSSDDLSMIKREWVDSSIDAHIKLGIDLTGNRIVGYDVADSGSDSNVCAIFNGAICIDIDSWKAGQDELTDSAYRAYSHIKDEPLSVLVYDSTGVGAHTGSAIKNINGDNYHKFVSSGSVANPDSEYQAGITNKQHFENLRAQAWQLTADRLRNTFNAVTKGMEFKPDELISIDSNTPHLVNLTTELVTIRACKSSRGLLKVESKDDIKKRLSKSPDYADAFVMGANSHLTSASDFDFTKYF